MFIIVTTVVWVYIYNVMGLYSDVGTIYDELGPLCNQRVPCMLPLL